MAVVATYAQTNGAATVAVTMPSGIAQNDLLLVLMSNSTAGGFSVTPPVGWTEVTHNDASDGGGSAYTAYLYYKIAGASEPSTYNFITGTGNTNYLAMRVINWDTTDPLTAFNSASFSTANATPTATAYTCNAPTLTRGNDLIVLCCIEKSANITPTTSGQTWTQLVNDTNTNPLTVSTTNVPTGTSFNTTTITPTATQARQANVAIILAIKSFQNEPTPLALVSTMGVPVFVRLIQPISLILSAVLNSPTVSELANKWTNLTKAVSSWTDTTKH